MSCGQLSENKNTKPYLVDRSLWVITEIKNNLKVFNSSNNNLTKRQLYILRRSYKPQDLEKGKSGFEMGYSHHKNIN